jgi:hypothetical protein
MTRPRRAAHVVTFLSVSRRGLSRTPTAKPLRVLFCGSDEFSGESLRAVHAEQQRNPNLIASIDVLLRRAKLSGRGLKEKRDGQSTLLAGVGSLMRGLTGSNSTY